MATHVYAVGDTQMCPLLTSPPALQIPVSLNVIKYLKHNERMREISVPSHSNLVSSLKKYCITSCADIPWKDHNKIMLSRIISIL